jgi:hypothetical protein
MHNLGGKMRSRSAMILGGIVLGVVVAGGSFFGGMAFQRTMQSSARDQFFALRRGPGGFEIPRAASPLGGMGVRPQGGPGGQVPSVFGTVKSVQGNTVLISTPQDVTTVELTDATSVRQLIEVDLEILQPGQWVMVVGEMDNEGIVTAVTIDIANEPND